MPKTSVTVAHAAPWRVRVRSRGDAARARTRGRGRIRRSGQCRQQHDRGRRLRLPAGLGRPRGERDRLAGAVPVRQTRRGHRPQPARAARRSDAARGRRLAQDAHAARITGSTSAWRRLADAYRDLGDASAMDSGPQRATNPGSSTRRPSSGSPMPPTLTNGTTASSAAWCTPGKAPVVHAPFAFCGLAGARRCRPMVKPSAVGCTVN